MYTYKNCTSLISLLSPFLFSPCLTQEAIKTLLLPSLPDFLATFVHILSSSDPANTDPGLVKEVVMTLCALLRSLPRALTPHIMQIVTPVWNLLVSSTPVYPFPSKDVTYHPGMGVGISIVITRLHVASSSLNWEELRKDVVRQVHSVLPEPA